MHRPIILLLALVASSAVAGPYIPAGDLALRHDIQRLADYGIITGPISTWPLAWGPILNDIRNAKAIDLPPGVADALARISQTGKRELTRSLSIPGSDLRTTQRAFVPFPSLEIGLSRGAQWCGDGRPCDFDTFVDLFLGRDNRRDDGIDPEIEPGNQLAGIDVRWTPGFFDAQALLASSMSPASALTAPTTTPFIKQATETSSEDFRAPTACLPSTLCTR